MAMDISYGLMVRSTWENLLKIRDMAKASSSGKMAENTKANGLKANNIELVFIEMLKEKKRKENV